MPRASSSIITRWPLGPHSLSPPWQTHPAFSRTIRPDFFNVRLEGMLDASYASKTESPGRGRWLREWPMSWRRRRGILGRVCGRRSCALVQRHRRGIQRLTFGEWGTISSNENRCNQGELKFALPVLMGGRLWKAGPPERLGRQDSRQAKKATVSTTLSRSLRLPRGSVRQGLIETAAAVHSRNRVDRTQWG
jgi:hypothetical protein